MITFCTNIFPGATWEEVREQLARRLPAIRKSFSPAAPLPVGLWLSGRAAAELEGGAADRFHAWCEEHGCFVPALNGFPFGPFHGRAVKERAYRPDWRSPVRLEHTNRLADLLSRWLPPGMTGSISTLPLAWGRKAGREELAAIRTHLRQALEHLREIRERTGKEILLALEPEPGCLLATTPEVVRFFTGLALPGELRELLALCYDCCHQALQFEDPAASLASLTAAGVRIARVQVTAGLRLGRFDAAALAPHCRSPYLHQTVLRRPDGALRHFPDLPAALAARPERAAEWRVHVHLPLHLSESCTTRGFVEEILPLLPASTLLEVETYTWGILPPPWRPPTPEETVLRDLAWLKERLDATHRGD